MCTLCFGGKSCIFATDRYYKDDGGVGEPGFDEAKKLAAPFLTPGSPRGVGGLKGASGGLLGPALGFTVYVGGAQRGVQGPRTLKQGMLRP